MAKSTAALLRVPADNSHAETKADCNPRCAAKAAEARRQKSATAAARKKATPVSEATSTAAPSGSSISRAAAATAAKTPALLRQMFLHRSFAHLLLCSSTNWTYRPPSTSVSHCRPWLPSALFNSLLRVCEGGGLMEGGCQCQ